MSDRPFPHAGRATRAVAALATLMLGAALDARPAAAQSTPTYTDCRRVVGNLVQNCSFDSTFVIQASGRGVPDGFTLTDNGGSSGSGLINTYAHSGILDFAFSEPAPRSTTLAQTLSTTVGATYQIEFWAQNLSGQNANNNMTVTFGADVLASQPLLSSGFISGVYTFYSYRGVATASRTSLAFTGSNGRNLTLLDDVSVTLVSGPTTTAPEPAPFVLLGAGLVATGIGLRRRRIATN